MTITPCADGMSEPRSDFQGARMRPDPDVLYSDRHIINLAGSGTVANGGIPGVRAKATF